jgi:hypothetical protein
MLVNQGARLSSCVATLAPIRRDTTRLLRELKVLGRGTELEAIVPNVGIN